MGNYAPSKRISGIRVANLEMALSLVNDKGDLNEIINFISVAMLLYEEKVAFLKNRKLFLKRFFASMFVVV